MISFSASTSRTQLGQLVLPLMVLMFCFELRFCVNSWVYLRVFSFSIGIGSCSDPPGWISGSGSPGFVFLNFALAMINRNEAFDRAQRVSVWFFFAG